MRLPDREPLEDAIAASRFIRTPRPATLMNTQHPAELVMALKIR
jgi:hypothetical protein